MKSPSSLFIIENKELFKCEMLNPEGNRAIFKKASTLSCSTRPACQQWRSSREAEAVAASLQEGSQEGSSGVAASQLWPQTALLAPYLALPDRTTAGAGREGDVSFSPILSVPPAPGFSQPLPPQRKQAAQFPSRDTGRSGRLYVLSYLRQAICNWQPPRFAAGRG